MDNWMEKIQGKQKKQANASWLYQPRREFLQEVS